MAKLAILLALVSLLALGHITAFCATVVEDDDQSRQQWCKVQLGRHVNLKNCQRYLSLGYKSQLESLNNCCRELGNIEEKCRCYAVNHAFKKQRGPGELEGLQRRAAESLPSRCKLSPQQCQIVSIWD